MPQVIQTRAHATRKRGLQPSITVAAWFTFDRDPVVSRGVVEVSRSLGKRENPVVTLHLRKQQTSSLPCSQAAVRQQGQKLLLSPHCETIEPVKVLVEILDVVPVTALQQCGT